jgi:hypothetical protein
MIRPRFPAISPVLASAMIASRGVFCSILGHHFS